MNKKNKEQRVKWNGIKGRKIDGKLIEPLACREGKWQYVCSFARHKISGQDIAHVKHPSIQLREIILKLFHVCGTRFSTVRYCNTITERATKILFVGRYLCECTRKKRRKNIRISNLVIKREELRKEIRKEIRWESKSSWKDWPVDKKGNGKQVSKILLRKHV